MTHSNTLRSFGRGGGRPPPPRRGAGPTHLAGPAEDLVAELQGSAAWYTLKKDLADGVYDEVKTRFEADKDQIASDVIGAAAGPMKQLASETVTAMTPAAQQALNTIFDDAQTQARIGQTQAEVRNMLIQVGAVGVLATAVLTTVLVHYAGTRR